MRQVLVLAVVTMSCLSTTWASQPWPVVDKCVAPEVGLQLAPRPGERVVLCPGHFVLPVSLGQTAISITGTDVEIVCAATVLDGFDGLEPSEGTAFEIADGAGITLTGCTVKNFRTGILVRDTDGATVDGHTFTGLFHDADLRFRPEGPYDCGWCMQYNWNNINRSDWVGGAVRIRNSSHVSVVGNLMSKIYNGVEAFESSGIDISRNRMAEITDWGVRLYDTDDSVVDNNHISKVAKWMDRHACSLGCPMDAAGILLVKDSDANAITHNEVHDTWGASGFFLGNEGTLPSSSDGNYIAENRIEHGAVGNAFEMTFGRDNVLEHNIGDDYATGIWPTYSRGYVISRNIIRNSRSNPGLALVNVEDAQVHDNYLVANPIGILVKTEKPQAWWGDVPQHVMSVALAGNTVTGGGKALVFRGVSPEQHPWFTEAVDVTRNHLAGSNTGIRFEPWAFEIGSGGGAKIAENNIDIATMSTAVDNSNQTEDLVLPRNWWNSFSTFEIEAKIQDQQDNPAWGDVDPNVLAVAPWPVPEPPSEAGIGNVAPYPPSWPIAIRSVSEPPPVTDKRTAISRSAR